MPFDWGEKLMDLSLGGLPGLTRALPTHWRQQAAERLRDFNPFASIAANEDLLRALRLAWVEAALAVDTAVHRAVREPEWQALATEVLRFSPLLCHPLREIRHRAWRRDEHPGHTPMDDLLQTVLLQVPDHVRGAGNPHPGQELTQRFVPLLAQITGWTAAEQPSLYARFATEGLPLSGSESVRRPFGELVFAAFAELMKNPARYPEAGRAFDLAMSGVANALLRQSLCHLQGLDDKLDRVLTDLQTQAQGLAAGPGLLAQAAQLDARWAGRWNALSGQVRQVQGQVEGLAMQSAQAHEATQARLQQILALLQQTGQVGPGPGQVAHDTVLALARRLRPDELLDFEQAVTELERAIALALQVQAEGLRHPECGDHFVQAVLQRVAAWTACGDLQAGANAIDEALAEEDRQEAQALAARQRRRAELQQAAIRQGTLMRDVDRVVQAVLALGRLTEPQRPTFSAAFDEQFQRFLREGCEQGSHFALETVTALGERRLQAAHTVEEHVDVLNDLSIALRVLGGRTGEIRYLDLAIEALRLALPIQGRERDPQQWATLQNTLGNALYERGHREGKGMYLDEAVQAYGAALQELTPVHQPRVWAQIQGNLGNALAGLGERETGAERLRQALQAHRAAVQVHAREPALPALAQAQAQTNLGNSLATLGIREHAPDLMAEAVQAHRAALQACSREDQPLAWAATQNNLGATLHAWARLEDGTAHLAESVLAYRAAAQVRTREQLPMDWAATQHNLANVLCTWGQREGNRQLLLDAVSGYQGALLEFTRDRAPLGWAVIQANLAQALAALGRVGADLDPASLDAATQACRAALEVFTPEDTPQRWQAVQQLLAELTGSTPSGPQGKA